MHVRILSRRRSGSRRLMCGTLPYSNHASGERAKVLRRRTRRRASIAAAIRAGCETEGVETLGEETFLREHACDETRGCYFGRPIASDEFAVLLRRRIDASK